MRCVVFSDDLTGANNIGVEFARAGLRTRAFQHVPAHAQADVVLINTDSRYLPSDEAAARVAVGVRQLPAGEDRLWVKKIDSLLRGNIGAEIEALMDATGQARCLVVAASPKIGRTTIGGYQLHEGVPIKQVPQLDPTGLGTHDHIPTLLRSQCRRAVQLCAHSDAWTFDQEGLTVADVATQSDLNDIVRVAHAGGVRCFAGTYGLGEALSRVMARDVRPVLVLVGSLSQTSAAQVQHLAPMPDLMLIEARSDPEAVYAQVREVIAAKSHPVIHTRRFQTDDLDSFLRAALTSVVDHVGGFVATGGTTAQLLLDMLGGDGLALEPAELFPGTPAARIIGGAHAGQPFLVKPGAQGDDAALRTMLNQAITMQRIHVSTTP